MRLYAKIVQGAVDFPESHFASISAEGKDLVKRLLAVNPDERLNCVQALQVDRLQQGRRYLWRQHPWLSSNAATPIQSTQNLKKYNVSRRFQNTGKQLLHCQRFNVHAQEEGISYHG